MRSLEVTGKSVDEAIFKGLQELGISIDEVKIEIIREETKGIFGLGSRPAQIRLTEKGTTSERTQRRSPAAQAGAGRPGAGRSGARERKPAKESPAKPARSAAPRASRPQEPVRPPVEYSSELAKTNPGGIFLSDLLKRMSINAEVSAAETADGLKFFITSDSLGILIGRRGETLDSLQYLTSLIINKDHSAGYTRVMLDTENYRTRREQTLMRLARKLASRVRSTGKPITLEPMNPYERRVLHSALQANPYVTTQSEGEDPNRRVTISPQK